VTEIQYQNKSVLRIKQESIKLPSNEQARKESESMLKQELNKVNSATTT